MATSSRKLKAIFSSLAVSLLFMISHSQIAFSFDFEDVDEDEVYVLDRPVPDHSPRSRLLLSSIRKGAQCSADHKNICNGVSANNGTSLLHCCKMHCRNILGDKNNCGKCGSKCKFGQLCCNGTCTNVFDNEAHCGKCNKKCPRGVRCEFGNCGYA